MAETFQLPPDVTAAILAWRDLPPGERVGKPLLPHLRRPFGLSPAQAIAAIRAANLPGADTGERYTTKHGTGGAHVGGS